MTTEDILILGLPVSRQGENSVQDGGQPMLQRKAREPGIHSGALALRWSIATSDQ
ncbi:MAG: hypothetical protein NTZ05_05025 [Chloroflexi bacterium]|nr:hypothetical protein [Chloroflexota bacterium]